MKILGVEVLPNGYDRWLEFKGAHPHPQTPARKREIIALKESLLDNSLQPVALEANFITLELSHQLTAL